MAEKYRNLLFLCTGNACRSQMAEGWARHLGGERVDVRSAGVEAHGLNPRAVAAMAEAGVDISAQASHRLTGEDLQWADLVVTVCGHADENCPVLPPATRRVHWAVDDPARAEGDQDTLLAVFHACRDEIRERVTRLLDESDDDGA